MPVDRQCHWMWGMRLFRLKWLKYKVLQLDETMLKIVAAVAWIVHAAEIHNFWVPTLVNKSSQTGTLMLYISCSCGPVIAQEKLISVSEIKFTHSF